MAEAGLDIQPIYQTKIQDLEIYVFCSAEEMGLASAEVAAGILSAALSQKSQANLLLAAANSQLTCLSALRNMDDIDWSRINILHMDEYIGLDLHHPARFASFLGRNFMDEIHPKHFFKMITTDADPADLCRRYEDVLLAHPIDLCLMGIGENGHLAFNDPPFADFADRQRVRIVELQERSRLQQVGEGHFHSLEEVPTHAITLTIPALLESQAILVNVPGSQKVDAIVRTLTGPIREDCPASILRTAPHARLYLDRSSAEGLRTE